MKISVNGRLIDADSIDADSVGHVSPLDRGLLYGDGLFETFRVRGGHIEFLSEHLRRLFQSIEALDLPFPWDRSRTVAALEEVVDANREVDLALRLTVTRGVGGTRLDTEGCRHASIFITASPYPPKDSALPADGLHLSSCSFPRNELSPLTRHKTINYLEPILARSEARRNRADEALLQNTQGRIAEAGAANIFLVREGCLVTPSIEEGALPGIVRAAVIRVAGEQGLPTQERRIESAELFSAGEIFLTNSLLGLASVARIDGETLAGPARSPWLPTLREGVEALASGDHPSS